MGRAALALALGALALAFAGCAPAPQGEGVRAVALYDGAVRVQGPEGYCVDRAASRARSGFAVLAGCGLLAPQDAMPALDGFLTVQFGEAGSAGVAGREAELRALLSTPAGAALLSRTGVPETVTLERTEAGRGIVVVEFADSAPAGPEGLEPGEWRAFLDIGGRMATLSLRAFSRAPLDRDAGRRLLSQAVSALRAVNRPGEG